MLSGGFVSIQAVLDQYILTKTGAMSVQTATNWGTSVPVAYSRAGNIELYLVPFPTPDWNFDAFAAYVSDYIGLFYLLLFIWPLTRIVAAIALEKELRLKEGMLIMGLQEAAASIAFVIPQIIVNALTAGVLVATATISPMKYSSPVLLWAFFFLFLGALCAFAFAVSACFDRARPASTFAAIFFIATYFIFGTLPSAGEEAGSQSIDAFMCLTPGVALGVSVTTITHLEAAQRGLRSSTIWQTKQSVSVGTAMVMLGVQIAVYGIIYGLVTWMRGGTRTRRTIPHVIWNFIRAYFLRVTRWLTHTRLCRTMRFAKEDASDAMRWYWAQKRAEKASADDLIAFHDRKAAAFREKTEKRQAEVDYIKTEKERKRTKQDVAHVARVATGTDMRIQEKPNELENIDKAKKIESLHEKLTGVLDSEFLQPVRSPLIETVPDSMQKKTYVMHDVA